MKNLKIIVLVIAAHVAGLVVLMTAQGCRSTTAKSKDAALPAGDADEAPAVAAAPRASAAPAAAANPPLFEPISLNWPGAGAAPATPPADRYAPTRPNDPAAADYRPAQTYVVARNDTLAAIAKKFGFTAEDIAKANNLPKRSTLQIGQKLVIPAKTGPASAGAAAGAPAAGGPGTYTVKSGDSLYVIAKKHGVTLAALRQANGLASDALKIGQVLKLPGGATAPAAKEPAAPSGPTIGVPPAPVPAPASNSGAAAPAAAGYGRHVVQLGETLNGIANRYKVSAVAIMTANSITNAKSIRPGQELRIPGAAATAAPPQPAIEAPAAPVPAAGAVEAAVPAHADEAPVVPVSEDAPVVPVGK